MSIKIDDEKERLIKTLKGYIQNDEKSGVRISVSNIYGQDVYGFGAQILLKWLECHQEEVSEL